MLGPAAPHWNILTSPVSTAQTPTLPSPQGPRMPVGEGTYTCERQCEAGAPSSQPISPSFHRAFCVLSATLAGQELTLYLVPRLLGAGHRCQATGEAHTIGRETQALLLFRSCESDRPLRQARAGGPEGACASPFGF